MRRIACVALPEIRVEIAREGIREEAGAPLAVVVARPGGTVKSERDILGNTRLDVVSHEALAMGVRAGQTVAAARAKVATLRVRVVAEGAVRAALERIAEAALAFGPATGLDVAHDVVWVDVDGCAHLHGGEAQLARALEARVVSLGHACRVAVAGGPRIASAVARLAVGKRPGPLVVPEGRGAAAMRALPIAALALDDDVTAWLRDLGLPRCGDLQKLPRRSLGVRLGARVHDVMQLLDGEDRAPLVPWRPAEVPEERMELEWGAASIEALAFVLKSLADRLSARLQGRAMAAARIELLLSLDRALCDEGVSHLSRVEIVLPVPIARAADLLAVLRVRLERHVLAAPVMMATLRATELARAQGRTLDLLEPEPVADRALPRLVAELSAELGPAQVGLLALADTWSPDERTRLVPYGMSQRPARRPLVTSALEPTRLAEPRPVDWGALVALRPPVRVESIEWWRRAARRRDMVAVWMTSQRDGALGWVELGDDDSREVTLRGWMD
jgi:protein ImuB